MPCPISHTPTRELRMAVRFRGGTKTVFDAEHVVCWLRSYSMRDPVTNCVVCDGMAFDILEPCRLEHSTDEDVRSTEIFLKSAGYLDGSGGGREVRFFNFQFFKNSIPMRTNLRWFVTQAVWINQHKLPIVAVAVCLVMLVLSIAFWFSVLLLIEESAAFSRSVTLKGAADLAFFFLPISFAAGCYFFAYVRFLQTILLAVVNFLVWSFVIFILALCPILVLWTIYSPVGMSPLHWMAANACVCAREYVEFQDYRRFVAVFLPKVVVGLVDAVLPKLHFVCLLG